MTINDKPPALRLESVQSVCSAYPESALLIFTDRIYFVIAYTGGIIGIVEVGSENLTLQIIPVQPSTPGAYPESPGPVLIDRSNRTVRKRGGVLDTVLI